MLSSYVLLFLFAGRYLIMSVDPSKHPLALLLFPFVYNHFLQKGFYNFVFSLGFCMLAIGFWWRHHHQLKMKHAVLFNLIMVCCYFSHMVSTVIALLAVAILWLVTLRPSHFKRHLVQIPLLLPACFLPVWFITAHGAESNEVYGSMWSSFVYFYTLRFLFSFGTFQLGLGILLGIGFVLLLLVKIGSDKVDWERRRLRLDNTDGFLLVSATCLALSVFLPDGMSGGDYILQRLCLYPFLIALPWLTLTESRRMRHTASLLFVLIACGNAAYLIHLYPKLDSDLQEFRAGLEHVDRDSRLLALVFDKFGQSENIGMFLHGSGYYCAYTGGIAWDNYEAALDYFPVRFKPEFAESRPELAVIEGRPEEIDLARHADIVDFVLTWSLPAGAPVEGRIEANYELVFNEGRTRIYRRNDLAALPPAE